MRWTISTLLACSLMAGCTLVGLPPMFPPTDSEEREERLMSARMGLVEQHLPIVTWTRTRDEARDLCARLGTDVLRIEGRWWIREGGTLGRDSGRVIGCYLFAQTVARVVGSELVIMVDPARIICARGDQVCVNHEMKHHKEGRFHGE